MMQCQPRILISPCASNVLSVQLIIDKDIDASPVLFRKSRSSCNGYLAINFFEFGARENTGSLGSFHVDKILPT